MASGFGRGQFPAPKFLPFMRETNQTEGAEIEDDTLFVGGGRRRSGIAEVVSAFNFRGGNIAGPKGFAGGAVIGATLQGTVLERAQENAFAPNAGRGMSGRNFSGPDCIF